MSRRSSTIISTLAPYVFFKTVKFRRYFLIGLVLKNQGSGCLIIRLTGQEEFPVGKRIVGACGKRYIGKSLSKAVGTKLKGRDEQGINGRNSQVADGLNHA